MKYDITRLNLPCQTEERKVSLNIKGMKKSKKRLILWGIKRGAQKKENYGINSQVEREYKRIKKLLDRIIIAPNNCSKESKEDFNSFEAIYIGYLEYFEMHAKNYDLKSLRWFRQNIVQVLNSYATNYNSQVIVKDPDEDDEENDYGTDEYDYEDEYEDTEEEDFCL